MKSHFIREKYDYSRYGNKLSKLTVQGFYKRRDRMFFERMSRQYNDQEIQDFFIANFATDEDPSTVYMPNIIKNGEKTVSYTHLRAHETR